MERTETNRSLHDALRVARSREAQERFLAGDDDEEQQADGADEAADEHVPLASNNFNNHADLPVYTTIHRIRRLVRASIDDPYTPEQLKEPRMNVLIVKPLVDRFFDPDDISVVYCLLVNRVQFLREQSYQAHHQTVNSSRAALCEILAIKILRRFDEENSGREGLLLLANILIAGFEPFQNAPEEVVRDSKHMMQWSIQKRSSSERTCCALEIGIISESKAFLAGTACQKVVDAVYRGRIVYTPTSFIDILPDHYKRKPICLYDPRKAPLLNQYRLIVPRIRSIIEVCQFFVLLVLYFLAMTHRNHLVLTGYEVAFIVYAAGWVLDEFASMLEHGWHVHTQNLWSFLDVAFVAIYLAYVIVRVHGFVTDDVRHGRTALDLLSIAAPVLLPRLAFNLMPENMLFVSLRAMMGDFTSLTALAVWCFAGFLLAMKWLTYPKVPAGEPAPEMPDAVTISKWMLWIWFGLDGTGIQRSPEFDLVLGPALMVAFAFLGNTLFLTILVSILSNTFAKIVADATAEIQFRRAVLTFEGVKSDAIFAYRPPFNILAMVVLLPLKFVLSPRWFHKINVVCVRTLNAPLLLIISLYERSHLWRTTKRKLHASGPGARRSWLSSWNWSQFSVHGDVQAVFEVDPPQAIIDEIEEVDIVDEEDNILSNGFMQPPRTFTGDRSLSPRADGRSLNPRRRRMSSATRVFPSRPSIW
ncbi:hypothetical protein BDY21DRAFT_282505 [Lineolata rhizophorae]|uniref:Receptor-activated Ca2+-permeable cation channel n=1 Tax=Lineolata rhizophorae TaxID=578093 RepID=A0A6A6P6V6_9PEZI|nr:hypothetical protein BDY21DRAFT_282505 [Lineolata rhizophorae]